MDKNKKKNKDIIDLKRYIKPEMMRFDENGSYTGMTKNTYYDGELEQPIQDADDL